MRSLEEHSEWVYPKPSRGALPTLLLALAIWAAIFAVGFGAWSVLDLLR